MDLKIVKEKEPQLKLKKEAEVAVHTKNYLSSVKKGTLVFRKKPDVDILGYRKKEAAGKGDTEGGLSGRRKNAVKKQMYARGKPKTVRRYRNFPVKMQISRQMFLLLRFFKMQEFL